MQNQKLFITLAEASERAKGFLKKDVSKSNISYLVQYGKIRKHKEGGATLINIDDLLEYYQFYHSRRERNWKKSLGDDLNWDLSFDHLREKDTTKHVHRLHPYKGKFIPQLVQHFIKQDVYFKKGDIILDPFCGSGTTLAQASEMGIHSIGIDVSRFNCMIADVKLSAYDFDFLKREVAHVQTALLDYEHDSNISGFEQTLLLKMSAFNQEHFSSPEFKYQVQQRNIDENSYGRAKEKEFLKIYHRLVKKYDVKLKQQAGQSFLDLWYCKSVRKEIDFALHLIEKIKNADNRRVLTVILSRTIRSCRATTHSDLATLKEPQLTSYYCFKHKKICKPLFSIKHWFDRYANDTLKRLQDFDHLKQPACFAVLPSDSRHVDVFAEVAKRNKKLYSKLKKQKIRGIFTSPPYVGQIDYHEQHAYAYDLFDLKRRDDLEIGPLFQGQGAKARSAYVENISKVLRNCRKYLAEDFDIFLVANDKYNLYPEIAKCATMQIVNQFKRPVLNRTERDQAPYSEIIFHMKEKT